MKPEENEQETERLNASLFAELCHVDMAYSVKDCCIVCQVEVKKDGAMTIEGHLELVKPPK